MRASRKNLGNRKLRDLCLCVRLGLSIEDAVRLGLYNKRVQFITARPIAEAVILHALQAVDPTFMLAPRMGACVAVGSAQSFLPKRASWSV